MCVRVRVCARVSVCVHVCWRKRKWSECSGKKKETIVLRASSQTDQGAEEAPQVKAVQLRLRDCSLYMWEGEMKTDRRKGIDGHRVLSRPQLEMELCQQ